MRVIFMGTPWLAAQILEGLAGQHDVVGVFTRSDAIRGRGKELVASPVKVKATELGLDVFTPTTLKSANVADCVSQRNPDVICVAAYGAILPPGILEIPRLGCINVHTSLLPRWRGAAPIQRCILSGDEETGVCIMRMEEGLDTGAYCICEKVPVDRKSFDELESELAQLGTQALLRALESIESGTAVWTEQPETGITYADKIGKGELNPSPDETVEAIDAKVRASSVSHPCKLVIAGRGVAVLRSEPIVESADDAASALAPGEVAFERKRLIVGAFDGALELKLVKPDGKRAMEGRAFAAGLQGLRDSRMSWGVA